MQARLASNRIARAAAVVLATIVLGGAGVGVTSALGRSTGAAKASRFPSPARTITARPIARVPRTLETGTAVEARQLGHRVFIDTLHGFALASVGQAQYPVASVDGGTTWRVSGPALHLNAAQAPLSVCEIGALNRLTYFAYGCGEVVDTTNDGGKHWWRTYLGGGSLAVVDNGGRLIALVEARSDSGSTAATWAYVSSDGGRRWHYENRL
jgi:hypothetical protein